MTSTTLIAHKKISEFKTAKKVYFFTFIVSLRFIYESGEKAQFSSLTPACDAAVHCYIARPWSLSSHQIQLAFKMAQPEKVPMGHMDKTLRRVRKK